MHGDDPDAPAGGAPAPGGGSPQRARRRRLALRRRRRVLLVLALWLPALAQGARDVVSRPGAMLRWDWLHALGYLGALALSGLFWALPLLGAAPRRGWLRHVFAALFIAAYGWLVGVSQGFFTRWGAYATRDTLENLEPLRAALTGALPRATLALHVAGAASVAALCVLLARHALRARRRVLLALAIVLTPGAVYGATFLPVSYRERQSTTGDFLYIGGLVERSHRLKKKRRFIAILPRRVDRLPALVPRPARPRNVLCLVQESVRADAVCAEHDAKCDRANRATNAALPDRHAFLQARSNDATTTVSMWVLFSGLTPTAPRELVGSAPFLWHYAAAAGYRTGYFTSHNLLFGNQYLLLNDFPGRRVAATDIEPDANFWYGVPDAILAERVIHALGEIAEPFFVVLYSCNVHVPRLVDPAHSPFPPSPEDLRGELDASRSHYLNAIYLSDLAMARVVQALRATERGRRTVIVGTSDHGESFGEHGHYPVHGYTAYEEEIHVPLFVDAPPGTLSDEERASLVAKREAFVYHLDFAPTVLDLLGLWDEPALARHRARMRGHPLTRPELTTAPVPVSNVAWLWERRPSWGVMQGARKLVAAKRAARYSCYDVVVDPSEREPLPQEWCIDLEPLVQTLYGGAPRRFRRLRRTPKWGEH
ncbi:MAG: sulfatase-like hydrolase/transferase [Deltaproteobacteria bacterium]|nr:sulfatase-like hydrolase/transferase [Deltaproteobacteria bacterium]